MNLNNIEPASELSTASAALRRRRARLVVFTLILILGAILLSIATRMTPHVRQRAIVALNERFKSDVDLGSLQISVFPRPEILGTGLVLRHKGRTDVAPLIKIGSYSASAGLWGLISSPLHLKTVELDHLEISIPPGGVHGDLADPSVERDSTVTRQEAKDERSASKLVDRSDRFANGSARHCAARPRETPTPI